MARKNTKLESTGAEYLVLGYLLRERVQTFKSPENNPDYDLIATNPGKNLSIRLQVKSRWATNSDNSFPIKNCNSEFVIFVALNCGNSFGKKGKGDIKKNLKSTFFQLNYARNTGINPVGISYQLKKSLIIWNINSIGT